MSSSAIPPYNRQPSRRRFLHYAAGLGGALLASRAGVALADPVDYVWVSTKRATALRIDPAGEEVRWLPKGTLLRVSALGKTSRLNAWCPAFATFGSVETGALEDAPAPDEAQLNAQRIAPMLPSVISSGELPGRVIGVATVRAWPEVRTDTIVRQLGHNAELMVIELVQGEDGDPWYRVSDAAGGGKAPRGAAFFVHHNNVRVPRTDFHPIARNPDRTPAKWFEADIEQPAILTAYEAGRPVWSSLALYGKQVEGTPLGQHRVMWRVARETMTSERVYPPVPRTAPGGYYYENVLYTQYFYWNGAAIHYNYWSSNWGYRGSRGCLGLPLSESKWAWDWAEHGTPLKVFA